MLRLLRFWRLGGKDLRLLWFALRQSSRPRWLFPAATLLGLYALNPMNLAILPLGLIDDFVILPLALHWLLRLLPQEIRTNFEMRRVATY